MCIYKNDQELLMNKITAREVWQVLKTKYEHRLSIISKKITTTQLDLSSLNMLKQCFQALLHRLSEKYCIICDDIDSQLTIVDEGIVILHK